MCWGSCGPVTTIFSQLLSWADEHENSTVFCWHCLGFQVFTARARKLGGEKKKWKKTKINCILFYCGLRFHSKSESRYTRVKLCPVTKGVKNQSSFILPCDCIHFNKSECDVSEFLSIFLCNSESVQVFFSAQLLCTLFCTIFPTCSHSPGGSAPRVTRYWDYAIVGLNWILAMVDKYKNNVIQIWSFLSILS